MRLHVFVMFFHTSMFTICNTTLVTSLFFPSGSTPAIWNLTKILMFLAQSISQLIIMYLIEKLSKPMVLKKEESPKHESCTEDEDDWNRSSMSSDFDIICYLRRQSQSSLQMQKSAKLDAAASNPLGESQKSVDLYDLKNSFNQKQAAHESNQETENPIITEEFSDEDAMMASQRLKHASKKHNNSSINHPSGNFGMPSTLGLSS